jgi:hypothetical protein
MEWRAYCIDTSVRVSDRFSNVLTSQRWQQEETKDGNRSKALSVLCAYYPRNVETLECFRVFSLRLDHATRPPAQWRGADETWVPPPQVSVDVDTRGRR